MDTAPLSEIKKELKVLSSQQLQEIILRLAKFKKENKELVHYLLFESFNRQVYVQNIKEEIDDQFSQFNRKKTFEVKKIIRKTLRNTKKYVRFSGSKEIEMELLIYFCLKIKNSNIRMHSNRGILILYQNQLTRIKKINSMLHEDLQSDFEADIKKLEDI